MTAMLTMPRVQTAFALILLAAACWFSLFNRLDAQPMKVFDEIRLADNAIEMAQTGSLVVTRFDGAPDFWNTKPPLQIWLEASSVKLLGIRTLAFRLPSALAALATVLTLFVFARRRFGDSWHALLAAGLLLSSSLYVLVHCARNGEYDAMLVLWMTAASLAFFTFVWRPEQEKWLWLTTMFMVLAVYTKGIQGLILVPGFVIYAAVMGRFKAVFGRRRVYYAAGAALLTIGLYYVGREHLQPGYLHAVWRNELFGRYAVVNEGHHASFFAYFIAMKWWTVVLVYGIFAIPLMKGEDRRLGIFAIIVATSYLLVISLSKTKLEWYAAPVYPLLALLAVVSVRSVIGVLPRAAWTRPAVIVLTCAFTVWSVSSMSAAIDRSIAPFRPEERYPVQLAAFEKAFPAKTHIILGAASYPGPAVYYRDYFAKHGLIIAVQTLHGLSLQRGQTILTSAPQIKRELRADYDTKTIFSLDGMEGRVVKRVHPPHSSLERLAATDPSS